MIITSKGLFKNITIKCNSMFLMISSYKLKVKRLRLSGGLALDVWAVYGSVAGCLLVLCGLAGRRVVRSK